MHHIALFIVKKLVCVLLLLPFVATAQWNQIDLSGKWHVTLDKESETFRDKSEPISQEGIISLPGSLAEHGYGWKTTGSDFGILTPEYKYIGKAWYKRTINIPADWEEKTITIYLERVLWESRVFIDGVEFTTQDALGTPHIHQLGKLPPGEHELTIRVNNEMIHNIGDKGHAYGEYTQSIWNGIVGRIELQANDPTHFESADVYSELQNDQVKLKSHVLSTTNAKATISYKIISSTNWETVLSGSFTETLDPGNNEFEWTIPVQQKLQPWSEFNPEVYVIRLSLETRDSKDYFETEFGYHQVTHDGTKIRINDTPVFLRGNLDCVHFPLTGYPSCNVEDWEKIFRIYKEYGLNHARFHSWCPPEAAFKAANRVGIYLQAEASIWIDWWMSTDMVARGRPEMDTKGHPKGLGFDPVRDQFVIAEMNRMIDLYGNHPSFTLFCIGNELGNSDFDVMKTWVDDLKKEDSRRLYSVSTARKVTEVDDYMATHLINGVGFTRGLKQHARTDWNFEETYGQMNIPIIAHEIGQWPVYPRWSEIKKYTGVLKARNLEEFRVQATKNGIEQQADDFADASGALNQIMYKYEIESFLRTPGCAGIQLLSMQDYQGQGEALIGWLDCHWDSKGITTPEKFRQHYSETVPLLLSEKYVWENTDTFSAKIQISHHAEGDLRTSVNWQITDENGQILNTGTFDNQTIKNGSLTDIGSIRFNLTEITKAQKLKIQVAIPDTEYRNEWDIWVYPHNLPPVENPAVIVADKMDDEVLQQLNSGANVLLQAAHLGEMPAAVKLHYYPLYWSLTFFPGQGKTNIGLLVDADHPAFQNFPTSFHSNWQWEKLTSEKQGAPQARGFILNELPKDYLPIAQPVDDFHRNNKVGSIFELKVGKGKLLVCGYDLKDNNPVARQLKYSLLRYMTSGVFSPDTQADENWLLKTFTELPQAETADLPEELRNALLVVEPAGNLKTETTVAWTGGSDQTSSDPGVSFLLLNGYAAKDANHAVWQGREMELHIDCPDGILGTLLVQFEDQDAQGRTGWLDFEGRITKLGLHRGDGTVVRFHVMREDSNDGKLVLKINSETGPNLNISRVVLVQN